MDFKGIHVQTFCIPVTDLNILPFLYTASFLCVVLSDVMQINEVQNLRFVSHVCF